MRSAGSYVLTPPRLLPGPVRTGTAWPSGTTGRGGAPPAEGQAAVQPNGSPLAPPREFQPDKRRGPVRLQVARAVQQLAEQRPHLHPRQLGAEAEVRSVAEGQVRVGFPADVEAVG